MEGQNHGADEPAQLVESLQKAHQGRAETKRRIRATVDGSYARYQAGKGGHQAQHREEGPQRASANQTGLRRRYSQSVRQQQRRVEEAGSEERENRARHHVRFTKAELQRIEGAAARHQPRVTTRKSHDQVSEESNPEGSGKHDQGPPTAATHSCSTANEGRVNPKADTKDLREQNSPLESRQRDQRCSAGRTGEEGGASEGAC